MQSGEISQERLDRSVLKILKAKAALDLQKARLVDINALANVVGKPENLAFGQHSPMPRLRWCAITAEFCR